MGYKAGGKGYGQRMPHEPSWARLEVIGNDGCMIKFQTMTGYKSVPIEQVLKYEKERGRKVL